MAKTKGRCVSAVLAVIGLFVAAAEPSAAGTAAASKAAAILKASGLKGGLIVCIGCGDPQLLTSLRAGDSYLVQGLDTDAGRVAKARALIEAKGLCGTVTARLFDGRHLPYIDDLVNMVVVSSPPGGSAGKAAAANAPGGVPRDEIMRVLAPRGVLVDAAEPAGRLARKAVPAGLDEWTHWLHGPDNNAVSRDTKIGICRNLQWIMPPRWGRHHNLVPSMSAMVSANGRIFFIIDEAPISVKGPVDDWQLVCRDAFNGLLLWRRPIKDWGWRRWSAVQFSGAERFKRPDQVFRRIVAAGDVLYATLGFDAPLVALDAATGRTIRRASGPGQEYLRRQARQDNPGR